MELVLKTDAHAESVKEINYKTRTGRYISQDTHANPDAVAQKQRATTAFARTKEMSVQMKHEQKRNQQIRQMSQLDSHERYTSDYMADAKAALQNYIIQGDKQKRRLTNRGASGN